MSTTTTPRPGTIHADRFATRVAAPSPLMVARNRATRLSAPEPTVRLAYSSTTGDTPRPRELSFTAKMHRDNLEAQAQAFWAGYNEDRDCCTECYLGGMPPATLLAYERLCAEINAIESAIRRIKPTLCTGCQIRQCYIEGNTATPCTC